MANGIFPRSGAEPELVGLPPTPPNLTGDCEPRYYGTNGCGAVLDVNALNLLMSALAHVGFEAGRVPSCGNSTEDLKWLANAMKEIACRSNLAISTQDPSETEVQETIREETLPDGRKIRCIEERPADTCPRIRYNKENKKLWLYDEPERVWIEYKPEVEIADQLPQDVVDRYRIDEQFTATAALPEQLSGIFPGTKELGGTKILGTYNLPAGVNLEPANQWLWELVESFTIRGSGDGGQIHTWKRIQ